MPVTNTPLRYPGGKTQLTPLVLDVLRHNGLFYGEYAEPFAGGAGIACSLLLDGYVSRVHINDLDPAIHAFWWSVVHEPERLCQLISRTPVTLAEWRRQKAGQDANDGDLLKLGFSTFFLNRTNRSGIINRGVIGGFEQKGNYPIDCRFHKVNLIKKIERLAAHAEQMSVTNLDGLEFLKGFNRKPVVHTLINIDPPYYVRGPELYKAWFTAEDHSALSKAVAKLKASWMVTYDSTPETQELYKKYPSFSNSLRYTAQVKRSGVELLVVDPRLHLPPWLEEQAGVAPGDRLPATSCRRGAGLRA
jgi:DNA adenine methylase